MMLWLMEGNAWHFTPQAARVREGGGELHCSVIKVKMKRLDILWWGYIARMLNYGLRGVLCTSVEARKRIDWTSLLDARPARILKILEGGEGES